MVVVLDKILKAVECRLKLATLLPYLGRLSLVTVRAVQYHVIVKMVGARASFNPMYEDQHA